MARLILSDIASRDQADILGDLAAKAGLRTAAKYRGLFSRIFELVTDHPEIGSPRPFLGHQMSICIVPPYVVIYRYDQSVDTVTVLRIIHGHRKVHRAILREQN